MQTAQRSPYVLTADIGGSHITAGICNIDTDTVSPGSLIRAEVASKGEANEILSAWGNALKAAVAATNVSIAGLALAMPGPFDYENGISYIKGLNKYESIYGVDIRQYLAAVLQVDTRLIRFRNDAESTIAGEAAAGAGRNYNRVIGITLGTGFGSAFSEAGSTKDLNLGSQPYRESIADDYFSTRWFVKRYHELTGELLAGGVEELATLAERNQLPKGIFDEFTDGLSEFLSKAIGQLQPEVLVVCGNIARAKKLFLPRLSKNLSNIDIFIAQLGENAPLIGASAIFKNAFGRSG